MSALCCEIGNQRNAIAILHQLFFLLCIYILLSCCGFFPISRSQVSICNAGFEIDIAKHLYEATQE